MRVILAWLLLSATAVAQEPISNPRGVLFACIDHGADTGHEIDILDSTGKVIHTIQGGDPAPIIEGGLPLVRIDINVQPVTFGTYTVVVRSVAGTLKSANSLPSDPWSRVPGQPGKPKTGG